MLAKPRTNLDKLTKLLLDRVGGKPTHLNKTQDTGDVGRRATRQRFVPKSVNPGQNVLEFGSGENGPKWDGSKEIG